MNVDELRAELHRVVDAANEEQLYHLSRWQKEQASGFLPDEYGVTVEEYNREIDEAVERVDRGEYYTHEQVTEYMNKKFGFEHKVV